MNFSFKLFIQQVRHFMFSIRHRNLVRREMNKLFFFPRFTILKESSKYLDIHQS